MLESLALALVTAGGCFADVHEGSCDLARRKAQEFRQTVTHAEKGKKGGRRLPSR